MQNEINNKIAQLDAMTAKTWKTPNNIRDNPARIGNFSSSEIVALTKEGKTKGTFGVKALTYIEETKMERRLQRPLSDECNAHPLTWGKFLEPKVGMLLGDEYSFCSDETIIHPTLKYWVGSPDGFRRHIAKTVVDTKCPLTLKSFCKLVDPLYEGLSGAAAMQAVRANHDDGEKFYWQLVSNGILSDSRFAELIVYMPYLSELPEIQLMALSVDETQLSKHSWIAYAGPGELPFILDNGYYKNVNVIRFEIPQSDKDKLTNLVIKGGELLTDSISLIATHNPESGDTIIESVTNIPLIKL